MVMQNDDGRTSSADGSSESSSEGAALTPEQRDAQIFAKYGYNPDGSNMSAEVLAARDAASKTDDKGTEQAKPDAKADPDKGEDKGEGTSDDDGEGAAGTDEDEGDGTDDEISDERADALLNSLKTLRPDRVKEVLLSDYRAEIEKELRDEFAQTQRTATEEQQRESLIRDGRKSVTDITDVIKAARKGLADAKAELAKVSDPDATVDPAVVENALKTVGENDDQLMGYLAKFAVASSADVTRRYDNAFIAGFRQIPTLTGGDISADEMKALEAIANSASRIENDPRANDENLDPKERAKYGPDAGKRYFFTESFKFVVTRAAAHGKAQAIADAKAARAARKQILDGDAVVAAAAKEAVKRGKLPPNPTKPEPVVSDEAPTIDNYRAAVQAGDRPRAERIREAMQTARAAGRG